MWNKIVILFFCPITLFAICIDGKIKFVENQKYQEKIAHYCFSGKDCLLVSQSCLPPHKCRAHHVPKKRILDEQLKTNIGSPGHQLCQLWGGNPEIIELLVKDKWKQMSRCRFGEDFVGMDVLFILNESFGQNDGLNGTCRLD
jgi:hypothetical protein